MKKIITMVLCLCIILTFAVGCDNDEQVPATNSPDVSDLGSFSERDIALEIGGEVFYCGEDVSDLLKKLGDNYHYSEAMSCAYDGMDKIFSYEEYDVYTYPDGDIDRVSEISIYTADAATTKGLKVGDSVERMEELYGAGYVQRGITLVYEIPTQIEGAQSASLFVVAQDGVIETISITAEILVE